MSTKMKGLLKGLRYISQIFDEEEPELQIGMPTDVKHVAHIGWDGPTTTTNGPSWINQFRDEADSATAAPHADLQNGSRGWDPTQPVQERRASTGSSSSHESLSRHRSEKHKGSRWHSSSENSPRKSSTSEQGRAKLPPGPDSPARDSSSSTSKISRRKKSKGSSSSSSKKSSKSKTTAHSVDSLPYSDSGLGATGHSRSTTGCQSSVLKPSEEDQKALEDKSRRIHAL